MREIFNDNLNDLKWLPPVRFKGGSSQTTSRNIPAQTAQEAALQNNATNYANNTMGTANNLVNNTNQVVGDFGNVYDNYNNTANTVNNGYTSLLNGEIPSTYADARQRALNSDLVGTIGNQVSDKGSRGIINSTVMGSALNGIERNASDTLARNYASDLNSYAELLGNTATNNTNNLNNYTGLVSNQLGNANTAAGNTSNLFDTMYSGRMNSGGTTTTQSGGKGGLGGALGSVVGVGLGNSSFGSNW
jgi:hypothetical protein